MAQNNSNRISVEDILNRHDQLVSERCGTLVKAHKKTYDKVVEHDKKDEERSKTLMKGQKKVYDRVGLAERRILNALGGISRAELLGATLLGIASAIFAFVAAWQEAAEVGIRIRSIWSIGVGIMMFGLIVLIANVGGGKHDE